MHKNDRLEDNPSTEFSSTQTLRGAQIAHGSRPLAPGSRGRKNTIPTKCLLVHRDIVWQSSQQVQLPFNPSQNLLRGDENFQVPETD